MEDLSVDSSIEVSDCGGGVRQLLLRETKNRLSGDLRAKLLAAINDATSLPEVRAIVIGTAGKHFSVGGDIMVMQGLTKAPASRRHAHMCEGNRLAETLGSCTKPLVAAVHGACFGAGAGVALLCDTIIVGNSTEIGFPFLRIGLVPDFGISYTLKRRIGDSAARQVLLYAKTLKATEAIACGLADECVEDIDVLPRAVELATRLAAMPAEALRLTREVLRDSASCLKSALRQEALTQSHCFDSKDMHEAVTALLEKRAPKFNEN